MTTQPRLIPSLVPLGDRAVLVQFADRFDAEANAAAIALARYLQDHTVVGVVEICPTLVSVLIKYDPGVIGFDALCGEIGLVLPRVPASLTEVATHRVPIRYGGEDGPDLNEVAENLGLGGADFIAQHGAEPLGVLAIGFAPGFIYCGMHSEALVVPRRETVRSQVSAGSVLFAAGQTAIAATPLPTGWAVIGRTDLVNFDPGANPPTRIRPGDRVVFEAVQ